MDTPVELESFPVKDLPERYGIGRTILYERMNALNISPEKQGNRGYISLEQLNLLDALNEHIKSGQTTPDFLRQHGITSEQGISVRTQRGKLMHNGQETETAIPSVSFANAPLLDEIRETHFTIQLLPAPVAENPWNNYEQLELIAAKGWTIPTSRLLPLLGRKSIPKLDHHQRFSMMGFVFWKVGRVGNQYEWKVIKQQD